MGASSWSYYVPYEADFDAALRRLHAGVFTAGTYYFTVTAVDSSGGESSFSNMASKTI